MQNPFSTKNKASTTVAVSDTTNKTSDKEEAVPSSALLVKNLEEGKVILLEEKPKTTVDFPIIKKETTTKVVETKQQQDDTQAKKRSLPGPIKQHFEANSLAFVAFAKQKEKTEDVLSEKNPEIDSWDKALLFEEYPNGIIPLQIEEKHSGIPKRETPSSILLPSIPQKTSSVSGEVLPTRIISETFTNETFHNEPKTEKEVIPEKEAKQIQLNRYIPKKPQAKEEEKQKEVIKTAETKENLSPVPTPDKPIEIKKEEIIKPNVLGFDIPKKPVTAVPAPEKKDEDITKKNPEKIAESKKSDDINLGSLRQEAAKNSPNESEMGDILKSKIIDGQLRGVFEGAPEGVKEMMEKMPAKELLSPKESSDKTSEAWKNRLREYIIKLKWQGKTVFGNAHVTDPEEDEMVMDYIKRIYPAIIRAEIIDHEDEKY